ncbi:MAG TPA: DUF5808 domain-containing protein [Chloroflexota bacterium]|nr:DUF5808 domain-containing protein [Chloroflexota bacterium]
MSSRRPKRFLGIPYDWQTPSWSRIQQRMWNPSDRRLLTPRVFGWGYTINFYELARRMGLIRRR